MKNKRIVGALVAVVGVASTMVFSSAISGENIMGAVTSGKNAVTRAEFAKILATNIADATGDDLSEYEDCAPDVRNGDKYENSICFLVEKGIFLPLDGENFKPKANVTREEAAQLFFVAYDYLVEQSLVSAVAEPDYCKSKGKCMYVDVKEEDGISYALSVVTDLRIVDTKPWGKKSKFEPAKALTKAAAKKWGENFLHLIQTETGNIPTI